MKAFTDNFDRRVVPRWRETSASAEDTMSPLQPRKQVADFRADVLRVHADLEANPSAAVAIDAINVAFLAQDKGLKDAAVKILNAVPDLPSAIRQLVNPRKGTNTLLPSDPLTHGDRNEAGIRRLRRLMLQYPKNPLLFLDLARHHAILGHDEKARQAAITALGLAPHHRLVLRSVARYLINAGQMDEAHQILARAPSTKHDPWLIAAEVAVSQVAKLSPRFWREGIAMLEGRAHQPGNLSELASAIGTREVLEGKAKKAKKRFDQALLAPTENSLAQVKWAEKHTSGSFNLDKWLGQLPSAHEALFMRSYQENDIQKAALEAQLWFYDEQFSPDAAMTASYVSSMLDDHDAVIAMTDTALISHPDNEVLQNNRMCALISSGRFFKGTEAENEVAFRSAVRSLIRQIHAKDGNTTHAAANLGLLAYRAGFTDEGRIAYQSAIDWAQKQREFFSVANATMFHAREAILAKAPWAETTLKQAREAATKVSSAGLRFYMEKVEAIAKAPDKAVDILSPISGVRPVISRARVVPSFHVEQSSDGLLTLVIPKTR